MGVLIRFYDNEAEPIALNREKERFSEFEILSCKPFKIKYKRVSQ
jgi:hypothetical protein